MISPGGKVWKLTPSLRILTLIAPASRFSDTATDLGSVLVTWTS
ncbi:MAG: hypothetical protein ABJP70_05840 [Erythrobacter sp.]